MGVFLEVSDDRTLTNLTLKEGYRTVYQYTSLVYTDAPLQVKKLFKQQLRWARGWQYNTLRMMPWMLGHAPMLAFFFADGHRPAVHALRRDRRLDLPRDHRPGREPLPGASSTSTASDGLRLRRRADGGLVGAQHGDPADAPPRREALRLLPPAGVHHRVDVLPHAHPPHRVLPHGHTPAAGGPGPGPTPEAWRPTRAARRARHGTPESPSTGSARVGRPGRGERRSTTCSPASTTSGTARRRHQPIDRLATSRSAAAAAAASAPTARHGCAAPPHARRYNPYAAIPY